ncbi:MAG: hypothetical protein QM655_05510 [Nocardioidaceae bacterium]
MKRVLVFLAAVLLLFFGSGSAFAASGPTATTDGSSAQFIDTTAHPNSFEVCDTDSDGDWVYVDYKVGSSSTVHRIEYHGGTAGGGGDGCIIESTTISNGKTVKYKSCQNDAFDDTCSGWKTADS